MKTKSLLVFIFLTLHSFRVIGQGTAFTYQGRLNAAGNAANGSYDFRFRLASDPLANNYVGGNVFTNSVPISNGLFTVGLDFGGVFNGSNYWLEIAVRTNGGSSYTTLSPLQSLTPTPYAIFAESSGNPGLAAGTYTNAVTLNNTNNSLSGTFIGNGASLSNVNAVTLGGLAAGSFWQLTGNNVTPGQFLGSVNNQPVEVWANGTRALRIEPATNGAPNVIGGAGVNFVDPGVVGATIAGGGNASGSYYLGGGSNHVSAIFGTIAGGRVQTVAADHAFIGGGISNTIQNFAYDSVIGGGVVNVIQTNASESVLGGGTYNSIQSGASYAFLGGGTGNSIQPGAYYSILGGGSGNSIQTNASSSVLAGGSANSIQNGSYYSFLGGGSANLIQANSFEAVVAGGNLNVIQAGAPYSFIGGGSGNSIQTNAADSVIGGGVNNVIQTNATYSFIGGGNVNSIQTNAAYSVVAGGRNNSIQSNATYAVVGGGLFNVIQTNADYSFIGGGDGNVLGGDDAVIAGGYGNVNSGAFSSVGGGFVNRNTAQFGTVGGGSSNTNSGYGGTVAGGQQNLSSGYSSAVGGGVANLATNQGATIAGGYQNRAWGFDASVGGGINNSAAGDYSVVAGGNTNRASSIWAMVGGGIQNISSGVGAMVPGGVGNQATGSESFAEGYNCLASADYSFAGGYNAQAVHPSAFVWSDSSGGAFSSTAANQFAVRAAGGLVFAGDVSLAGGAAYHNLSLGGGNSTGYLYGSYLAFGDGVHLGYNYYADASGVGHVINPGGATSRISVGYGDIALAVGGVNSAPLITMLHITPGSICANGAVGNCSDRNVKQDFAPVSPAEILDKVVQLPLSRWSYTNSPTIRHVGPMAQDFYSAFNVGMDEKHITDIDESGVALAAIQGLNQKLEEQRSDLKAKDEEIESLKNSVAELERLVHSVVANK